MQDNTSGPPKITKNWNSIAFQLSTPTRLLDFQLKSDVDTPGKRHQPGYLIPNVRSLFDPLWAMNPQSK